MRRLARCAFGKKYSISFLCSEYLNDTTRMTERKRKASVKIFTTQRKPPQEEKQARKNLLARRTDITPETSCLENAARARQPTTTSTAGQSTSDKDSKDQTGSSPRLSSDKHEMIASNQQVSTVFPSRRVMAFIVRNQFFVWFCFFYDVPAFHGEEFNPKPPGILATLRSPDKAFLRCCWLLFLHNRHGIPQPARCPCLCVRSVAGLN